MSNKFEGLKCCIVGSGFFGAVIAERITSQLAIPVLIIEKRDHIGGNSWSEIDGETGIEVHKYGSHIFHTRSDEVWAYVNRFSEFNNYQHRVWTMHNGRAYSMPINLSTINSFYGKRLTPYTAEQLISAEILRDKIDDAKNFEERAISLVGRPLYEAFIQGYSEKQWQTPLKDLPASIINRLPVRYSYDNHYFPNDSFEGIPIGGYHSLFKRMLLNKLICVSLETDFFEVRNQIPHDCLVIYTGPIDKFYNYRCGALSWRTLDFEREVLHIKDFQGTAVMNYADRTVPYTRIHEFKHYHPERYEASPTIIFREYSRFAGTNDEPFYPVNTDADKSRLKLYREMASAERNTVFGGRLASYKYLDMDQVIGSALSCFRREIEPRLTNKNLNA